MNNGEELNPWEIHRINLNRRQRAMADIKVPQQSSRQNFTPIYQEPIAYDRPSMAAEESHPTLPPRQKKSYKKLYFILSILTLLLILAGGAAWYFYNQSQGNKTSNSTQKDYLNSINEIRKVALLPEVENSNATLSVVLDPEEAKKDPNPSFKFFNFFENAQMGDYLLHYPSIGKYILYRPTTHQIINMLTIPPTLLVPDTSTSTATTTSSTTPKSR